MEPVRGACIFSREPKDKYHMTKPECLLGFSEWMGIFDWHAIKPLLRHTPLTPGESGFILQFTDRVSHRSAMLSRKAAFLLVWIAAALVTSSTSCPKPCRCENGKARCSNEGLSQFPPLKDFAQNTTDMWVWFGNFRAAARAFAETWPVSSGEQCISFSFPRLLIVLSAQLADAPRKVSQFPAYPVYVAWRLMESRMKMGLELATISPSLSPLPLAREVTSVANKILGWNLVESQPFLQRTAFH